MLPPCILPQLEFISRNHCTHSMQCSNHAAMRPKGHHCLKSETCVRSADCITCVRSRSKTTEAAASILCSKAAPSAGSGDRWLPC